ncbi:hypothetical protein [Streptococcus sobrinus]|nr:hypothetical protein [Streptococcus sobrinus]
MNMPSRPALDEKSSIIIFYNLLILYYNKPMTKKLELSQEILDQLDLQEGESVKAELYADRLVLHKQDELSTKSLPFWLYLGASSLAALIFYLTSWFQHLDQVSLAGDYSIISFLLGFGGGLGILFFTATFIKNRRIFLAGNENMVFWRNLPVIVLAFSVILLLVLLGFSWLLSQIFNGASFDKFTAALILGVSLNAVISTWGQIAERIRATWLTSLFTVIMISGALLAMATNSSRRWWQFNLSFLGTKRATNSWQFNLTLILAALVLIVLVDYTFVALRQKYGKSWRLTGLRLLLTLLGLDLAAVGYFPNDATYHHLHTRFAGYLVYIIIVLIVSVPILLPKVTKDLLLTSFAIGGVLVGLQFGFQEVHYLSLTAFEMSAFILVFTWLVLLFNHLEGLLIPEKRRIELKLG